MRTRMPVWTMMLIACELFCIQIDQTRFGETLVLNRLRAKRAALRRGVKIYVSDVCLPSDRWFSAMFLKVHGRSESETITNWPSRSGKSLLWRVFIEDLIDCLDQLLSNQIELDEWRFPVGFFGKFLNIQRASVYTVASKIACSGFLVAALD